MFATFFRGFDAHTNPQTNGIFVKQGMQGWVIVYVPGGDIYQLLDPGGPTGMTPLKTRIVKGGIKTLLTCVQLYWWITG